MRNSTGNFWQISSKSTKDTFKSSVKPKCRTPATIKKTTSSTQTDRVVLIKEENLNFSTHHRFAQNDSGMHRDYLKAVNYINSCHKFINALIERNSDKSNSFLLPMITNFSPIFPYLISKKTGKLREKKASEVVKSNTGKLHANDEEKKNRSNFLVKNTSYSKKVNLDLVPVGDIGGELKSFRGRKQNQQVTNMIPNHLAQIFASLQNITENAVKRTNTDLSNEVSKNLDLIKKRLCAELSKVMGFHKDLEKPLQRATITSPKDKEKFFETSVEIEYGDSCDKPLEKTSSSISSLASDSSYIKSDSDCEINITE